MEIGQAVDTTVTPPASAEMLSQARRRAKLLNAAAQVSRNVSSILNPAELLPRTVDLICEEYGFYYAGIFLIETLADGKRWAVLKAGRGRAGQIMMEHRHKLEVGGRSMIGACTSLNQARIAFDVGSGLPFRMEYQEIGKFGRKLRIAEEFSNWHVIEGVNTPMRTDRFTNEEPSAQVFITKIDYNVGLPDSLFTEPTINPKYLKKKKP